MLLLGGDVTSLSVKFGTLHIATLQIINPEVLKEEATLTLYKMFRWSSCF